MESDGEKVYRLFARQINGYKALFEDAEKEWNHYLQRYTFFDADFFYVSNLPHEYRTRFWEDKIDWLEDNAFSINYYGVNVSHFEHLYWLDHPVRYEEMEEELLAALHRYVLRPGTTNVKKRFVLRQLNPLAWPGAFWDSP